MITGGIAGLMAGLVLSALSFTISIQTGIILTLAFLIFSAVFYLSICKPVFYNEKILEHGDQAEAKIIEVVKTGKQARTTGKIGLAIYEFTIEVIQENGKQYMTTFRESVIDELMNAYRNNITLTVRFNPEKKDKIIVEKIGGKIYNDKYTIWSQNLN